MHDNIELTFSPLQQEITQDGHTIQVHIYRTADAPWVLEVVNAAGTSICWDDSFATDQEAWDELQRTIAEEGIEELAVDRPGTTLN